MIEEETEIWKPCPNYEKWYDVSNLGNVRSYHIGKGKVDRSEVKRYMSISIGTSYLQAPLSKGVGVMKTIAVHTLVAKAFVPNPYNRKYVHHKNNDKLDPRATNLEWVTSGQNQVYAYADGQKQRQAGVLNGRCKLNPEQVMEIFHSNDNLYKMMAKYDIGNRAVSDIKSGKLWSAVTGKKYVKKESKLTKLSKDQILEILHSEKYQDILAVEFKISQSCVSAIKTGRSYSDITGIKFNGRKYYEYFGIKNKVA